MRPIHRGYTAPWSRSREAVGLLGTFLVFLMSYPAQSDFLAAQTRHLVRQFVQLILVLLGLVTPMAHTPLAQWHRVTHKIHWDRRASHPMPILRALRPAERAEITSLPLNGLHRLRTYHFEGIATLGGRSVPNADVLVRLTCGEQTVTKGTLTGPNGSYRLETSIAADAGDPVDWAVEAYTADFEKAKIEGRKIVQIEEEQDQAPVVINTPVEFVVSLSR